MTQSFILKILWNSYKHTHTHTHTHTHKPTTRSKFSKIAGYKINIQKSIVFQTSMVVQWLTNEGDTGLIPALERCHMPWGNEAHGP